MYNGVNVPLNWHTHECQPLSMLHQLSADGVSSALDLAVCVLEPRALHVPTVLAGRDCLIRVDSVYRTRPGYAIALRWIESGVDGKGR